MKVKRFFGKDMRQALTDITNELGPEAAILANKKLKNGVEIIAAIDYDDSLIAQRHQPMEANKDNANEVTNTFKKMPNQTTSRDLEKTEKKNEKVGLMEKADFSVIRNSANQSLPEGIPIASPEKKASIFKHLALKNSERKNASRPLRNAKNDGVIVSKAFSLAEKAENPLEQEQAESQLLSRPNLSLVDYQVENLDKGLDFSKKSESKPEKIEHTNKIEWLPDSSITEMREELEQLKQAVSEQKSLEENHLKSHLLEKLVARGFEKKLAEKIAERASSLSNASQAWKACHKLLEKNLMVQNDCFRSGIVAFWGPSGVGKTTAIAKIAAHHTLINGPEDIAILSTDHYRIASYEQLKKYGQLIGCETALIESQEGLELMLKKFSHKSLILIDTGGISHANEEYYAQQSLLRPIKYQVKNVFVLASGYQYQTMNRLHSAFGDLKPEGILVTKTDESNSYGEIISLMINKRLMVCGASTGSKVTDKLKYLTGRAWIDHAFEKDSELELECV